VLCSLEANPIGPEGQRALAESVAANEDTALKHLHGVDLRGYLDVLGLADEFRDKDNDEILIHLQARRCTDKVKSAKGGVR
jgi:hypothetical protein